MLTRDVQAGATSVNFEKAGTNSKASLPLFPAAVLYDVEGERLIGFDEFFGPFQIDLHDQDHVRAWCSVAPDLRQTVCDPLVSLAKQPGWESASSPRFFAARPRRSATRSRELLFDISQALAIVDHNHHTVRAFDAFDLANLIFDSSQINVSVALNEIDQIQPALRFFR